MGNFWKNEWEIFKSDMGMVKEFFMQPVTFGDDTKMLKPSDIEIEQKSELGGFWTTEWQLFKQDLSNAAEFLTQPVTLK